jgi:hypothetical protein
MRSGLWAALVVIAVIWIVAIGFEREPCKQVEMVAAPARLVMWGARTADKNTQWVADPLTWLSWSITVDVAVQRAAAKVLHRTPLVCPTF